jgi:hypothetical protein
MDRRDLGRCHQCGNLLTVHGHFVAEGYQHEEYYCRACGGIERRAIRLRLDDPGWRKVYDRRQRLIAQGPTSGSFLKRRRGDAKGTRLWIEEIFRLGQRLVADNAPDVPAGQSGPDLGTRRRPARERRP